jgi:hypothetical protein
MPPPFEPVVQASWVLKFSQVCEQRRALFRQRLTVEAHSIGARGGLSGAGGCDRFEALEKFDVVVDHGFQSRGAVVVEVRRSAIDPPEARRIKFVPVIARRWTPDEAGQQRTSRIRARPTRGSTVRECYFIRARITGKRRRARRKGEPGGRNRIDRSWALGLNVDEVRHGWLRRGLPGAAVALSAGAFEYEFAPFLERLKGWIRIRYRHCAFPDRIGERANTTVR